VIFHECDESFVAFFDSAVHCIHGARFLDELLLALDEEPFARMIAAAQGDEVATKLAEHFPVEAAVLIDHLLSGDEITGGEPEGDVVGELAGVLADLDHFEVDAADGFDGVLLDEPLLVAALAPLGEVLLTDRRAVVLQGEGITDLGEGIEP
jgi:hypothetical protein